MIAPGYALSRLLKTELVPRSSIVFQLPLFFALSVCYLGIAATVAHFFECSLSSFFNFHLVGTVVLIIFALTKKSEPRDAALPWESKFLLLFIGLLFVLLTIVGSNNGLGFDEWAHISSQLFLLSNNALFVPVAFEPAIRPGRTAIISSYHDIYNLWFSLTALLSEKDLAELVFHSAGFFAAIEILSAYALAQTFFRSHQYASATTLFYLLIAGGGLIRAINTRGPARSLLFVALCLLLLGIRERRFLTLFIAQLIGGATIFIHIFFGTLWAGVNAGVVLILILVKKYREVSYRAVVAGVTAVLVLSVYVIPKSKPILDEAMRRVEVGQIAESTNDKRVDTGEAVKTYPLRVERSGLTWIQLTEKLRLLHPISLTKSVPPLSGLLLLFILVFLIFKRQLKAEENLLLGLITIPFLTLLNPFVAPYLEKKDCLKRPSPSLKHCLRYSPFGIRLSRTGYHS